MQDSAETKGKIIIALDVPTEVEARKLIQLLAGRAGWFKIGLQLFCAAGPDIVREVREAGAKVFLDLKFHDIPNTVQHAVAAASHLGAEMLSIHLLGGAEMCRAAVTGRGNTSTRLLGITILTSHDDNTLREVGVAGPVSARVLALAHLAEHSGLCGVVASPHETALLRRQLPADLTIVTPGVRPAWASTNDQKRTMTPREALAAGANHLVIGRPITAQPDPAEALARVLAEIDGETSVSPRGHVNRAS